MRRLTEMVMLLLCTLLTSVTGGTLLAAEKPNILWITAEDMSAVLGCYGDEFAVTPNIDKLAQESVLYTNAFATAPVCSPSRSCLINGVMATSQGTQQMRSAFPIPEEMTGFPSFLRKAGYYTSNNVKTDYNSGLYKTIIEKSWDESSDKAHWRNNKAKKPFFSIFNLMTSHQSRAMVWPYEKFQKEVQSKISPEVIHSPDKVNLPSYYPDHPEIRKTVARFYDCVTAMDQEVGALLEQLEADGLAENTIVFFYSDHGTGLPRHKRAALDSGLHVPLLVRFPKKWQHLAPKGLKAGSKTDRLVNFEDFGPTALSLADVKVPAYMRGKPFLGKQEAAPRDYVFAHRDRVDEAMDLSRSVRDKKFIYVRNFMPHISYNQPTAWPDLGTIRHAFYEVTDRKTMTDAQWHFAGPGKAIEELYDCEADPENIKNLANDPKYAKVKDRLSRALLTHIHESGDLGFLPEGHAWEVVKKTRKTPMALAAGAAPDDYSQDRLLDAALQVGVEPRASEECLRSDFPGARYWGAVGLRAAGKLSDSQATLLVKLLEDESATVRVEVANALVHHGVEAKAALKVLAEALEHENLSVVHHAARSIELLGEKAISLVDVMKQCDLRAKRIRPPGISPVVVMPEKDMAMFIGFSTNAFLAKYGATAAKDSGTAGGEWQSLFDGKTLSGWKADPKHASVKDGEIHIMSKGKNYWMLSEKHYTNFELTVDAFMPKNGSYNSGIGFRCVAKPGKKGKPAKPAGYQCEIDANKSGAIYAIGKGWVNPNAKKDGWDAFLKVTGDSFKEGKWNTFRILMKGQQIKIWVNDKLVNEVTNDWYQSGMLALQHHGKGDVHRFKNIKIKELR